MDPQSIGRRSRRAWTRPGGSRQDGRRMSGYRRRRRHRRAWGRSGRKAGAAGVGRALLHLERGADVGRAHRIGLGGGSGDRGAAAATHAPQPPIGIRAGTPRPGAMALAQGPADGGTARERRGRDRHGRAGRCGSGELPDPAAVRGRVEVPCRVKGEPDDLDVGQGGRDRAPARGRATQRCDRRAEHADVGGHDEVAGVKDDRVGGHPHGQVSGLVGEADRRRGAEYHGTGLDHRGHREGVGVRRSRS